jgi:hypothetical protein
MLPKQGQLFPGERVTKKDNQALAWRIQSRSLQEERIA